MLRLLDRNRLDVLDGETGLKANMSQYGGSPIKVGEEEYSLFRDHEYDPFPL
jgi:hypothetical protein